MKFDQFSPLSIKIILIINEIYKLMILFTTLPLFILAIVFVYKLRPVIEVQMYVFFKVKPNIIKL